MQVGALTLDFLRFIPEKRYISVVYKLPSMLPFTVAVKMSRTFTNCKGSAKYSWVEKCVRSWAYIKTWNVL